MVQKTMTNKECLDAVLKGDIPDYPPHFEMLFELEEEMLGLDPVEVEAKQYGYGQEHVAALEEFNIEAKRRLIDEMGWTAVPAWCYDGRTVALSLLRSVIKRICTETRSGSGFPSQKGGQSLGVQKPRYAVMPHKGNWADANVPQVAGNLNVPLRPVQTRRHAGTLPAGEASLFKLDNPALCFSTLKKAESGGGYIIRLYNPTSQTQKSSLMFANEPCEAWVVGLDEGRLS